MGRSIKRLYRHQLPQVSPDSFAANQHKLSNAWKGAGVRTERIEGYHVQPSSNPEGYTVHQTFVAERG